MYRRWLRSWRLLFDDIKTIAHHRDLYRRVTAMVAANPALHVPSPYYGWMQRAYVMGQASAIRRLVDWDPHAISLVKLMEEIADHPEVLSRRRFVGHYSRARVRADAGHRAFDDWTRPGGDEIDPRKIERQRGQLLIAHRRLRLFVNREVAHRDRRRLRRLPTYAELDRCVDVLERLAQDYSLILKAEGTSVVPSMEYGWDKPFRVPWIV